jgi:hypothetical protein
MNKVVVVLSVAVVVVLAVAFWPHKRSQQNSMDVIHPKLQQASSPTAGTTAAAVNTHRPPRLAAPSIPALPVRKLADARPISEEKYAEWLRPNEEWNGKMFASIDDLSPKVRNELEKSGDYEETRISLGIYHSLDKCLRNYQSQLEGLHGAFIAQFHYKNGNYVDTKIEASSLPASLDGPLKECLQWTVKDFPHKWRNETTTVIQPVQVPLKNENIYRILVDKEAGKSG